MKNVRKLNMGMIGGGEGSFIGSVHRIAAAMDGQIQLVSAALSSRPKVAKESGKQLCLPEDRIYTTFEEMILTESNLPEGLRMDFVAIVTPNNVHFEPAMLALNHGFHVVIDKPITFSTEEARLLEDKVRETGLMLCLTHTYSGYPMVKQAKDMLKRNELGVIRKIYIEYPQGWLSQPIEKEGSAQALWRTDPSRSGKAGCMGDIGTHAAHLAEYVSGLQITHLCANLNTYVEGRQLDDDGDILLKFEKGATGVLSASQIAAGEENALKIRIYGELGGLEWNQQEPNSLLVKWQQGPMSVYRAGSNHAHQLGDHALAHCRTPSGHPEGYLEAFANIYRSFVKRLSARLFGGTVDESIYVFPDVADGLRGMAFIDCVIKSAASDHKWTAFEV